MQEIPNNLKESLEDWFSIEGDIDDFIFYTQGSYQSEK